MQEPNGYAMDNWHLVIEFCTLAWNGRIELHHEDTRILEQVLSRKAEQTMENNIEHGRASGTKPAATCPLSHMR